MPFHMKTINTPISIRWKRSDKRKSQLGVTKEGGTTKGSPKKVKTRSTPASRTINKTASTKWAKRITPRLPVVTSVSQKSHCSSGIETAKRQTGFAPGKHTARRSQIVKLQFDPRRFAKSIDHQLAVGTNPVLGR